ncbi:uncharacterized protein A4U43_C10F9740 [Asparagus officinalis]|uniref:WRKY domain-containing protein n=1 Tax=Asparagus officinalis TaxID=4686 RepID=A0A5P1E263_ASPOF|nr:uncharacterized protein A4U43_C10F9740 [Asparagus officinalis]
MLAKHTLNSFTSPTKMAIIVVFVSLGALLFLAVALCCFLKMTNKKKKMVQEADAVNVSDRVHKHETVLPGPHGQQFVALTVDEDINIEGTVRKNEGQFTMTHKALLATVTAQEQMQLQAARPSSSEALLGPSPEPASINLAPLQQRPSPVSEDNISTPEPMQPPPSDHKSEAQSTQIVVKTSSSDGYNWLIETQRYMPCSAPVLRTIKEPKIVVQSSCDATRISDGYRWRKYG